MLKNTKTRVALIVGAFALGLLGFVSPAALADCEATPTAQVCSEEITTSLVSTFNSVVSGNALLIVGLVALAVAIPLVFRLVRGAANKVRV